MRNSQVGDLLVASTNVDGTILNRGVCLLVYEDDQTAIGLMLNRPLQLAIPAGADDPSAVAGPTMGAPELPSGMAPNSEAASNRLAELFGEGGEQADREESGDVDGVELSDAGSTDAHDPTPTEGNIPAQAHLALIGSGEETDAGKLLVGKALHFGGPLSGPIVAVHGSRELGEAEAGEGIYVAAHRDHLEALLQSGQPIPYRLIIGHLGWTQEQLCEEIAAGVWHRIPATADILSTADEWLWPKLIRSATASSVSRWLGVPHVADSHQLN
ncbi:MAG: YqgE/AlgH family protein [Rhodopirellula sp. JB044]|uniref:YqgE/AlgH family protein n=1 Tax=Rhodopirellula sp. JB044 TaxID=3342844 RepID=UPI00370A215F